MPGRLAIDFGTSNTLAAVWEESRQAARVLELPEFCRSLQVLPDESSAYVVPSVIHYAKGGQRWIGEQVRRKALESDARTYSLIKPHICQRSPTALTVDGRRITARDAGRDFLAAVVASAAAEAGLEGSDQEIVLTVPVEAYEDYEEWLLSVSASCGLPRAQLLDEPSAAALGYGAHVLPGQAYVVFDFGAGTLDVTVVLMEEEKLAADRRCRVLGKGGTFLGGKDLDQWLFAELLRRNRVSADDDEVVRLNRQLLQECEQAKIRLSHSDQSHVTVMNPETGTVLEAMFTRTELEDLLDYHDALANVQQTIDQALRQAVARGYGPDNVQKVFMVGGSSLIPAVQKLVQRKFGRERVLLTRPLDAVVLGAAACAAGVDFFDFIHHDYAIRSVDANTGTYSFPIIVPRGTTYPTTEPVAHKTIRATYDGQTRLGLSIFELGRPARSVGNCEIVYDSSGNARLRGVDSDGEAERARFWINETCPTFLTATPPGKQGEPCFEVDFGVNGNKQLVITVRDARTRKTIHRDFPVAKLS